MINYSAPLADPSTPTAWQLERIERDARPPATIADLRALIFDTDNARYPDHHHSLSEIIKRAVANHDGDSLEGSTIRWCRRCSMRSVGIWLTLVQANGVRVAHLRCLRCTGLHAARSERKIYPNSDGPVVDDRTEGDIECERCGADGSAGLELHHWAPRHLFRDAWNWPMSYLCVVCHREWHQRIKDHHR